MPRPIVLDNTVLTNFALVKHAALVFRLWPTACTTAEVMAEYQHGASLSRVPAQAWSKLPIVSLSETERSLAGSLSPRLGAGERTCLAVAYERHGLFVSDDLDARLLRPTPRSCDNRYAWGTGVEREAQIAIAPSR